MPTKRTTAPKANHEDWTKAAHLLTEAITKSGLSQAEVIRLSGVSDKTLKNYEAGSPMARIDKRRKLTAALGLPNDAFLAVATGATSVEQVLATQQIPQGAQGPAQDEALRQEVRALTEAVSTLLERLPGTWTGDPPPDPRSP